MFGIPFFAILTIMSQISENSLIRSSLIWSHHCIWEDGNHIIGLIDSDKSLAWIVVASDIAVPAKFLEVWLQHHLDFDFILKISLVIVI